MGVPLHGLLSTRHTRKLHIGLLLPRAALPFFLLFLSQFLSKWVGTSTCEILRESCQQLLGTARHAETLRPFLAGRLPSEPEEGALACHMHLVIRSGRPSLAGAQRGCILWRGVCHVNTQNTQEDEKRASFEALDAFWKSVLRVVWSLSGAVLTGKYFKLWCTLKYAFENNWYQRLEGPACSGALSHWRVHDPTA